MFREVARYVRQCPTCQAHQVLQRKPASHQNATPVNAPWQQNGRPQGTRTRVIRERDLELQRKREGRGDGVEKTAQGALATKGVESAPAGDHNPEVRRRPAEKGELPRPAAPTTNPGTSDQEEARPGIRRRNPIRAPFDAPPPPAPPSASPSRPIAAITPQVARPTEPPPAPPLAPPPALPTAPSIASPPAPPTVSQFAPPPAPPGSFPTEPCVGPRCALPPLSYEGTDHAGIPRCGTTILWKDHAEGTPPGCRPGERPYQCQPPASKNRFGHGLGQPDQPKRQGKRDLTCGNQHVLITGKFEG
ncbi:basic proline-rich protein-like [Monomorium pharaonis]|uniref:basic proline-rich protein-like n=1 Tax=Monomorium pharaonis TaxID=307658 RepID=UPI00174625F7|nr:basic proline-rich protein-like [Monomorium pharaonis]